MDVIDNLADTKLEGPYLSLSFSRIRRRDQADIACSAAWWYESVSFYVQIDNFLVELVVSRTIEEDAVLLWAAVVAAWVYADVIASS